MKKIINLTIVTFLLCGTNFLYAATVSIINHSFENGKNLPGLAPSYNHNAPDGWTNNEGRTGLQNISGTGTTGSDGNIAVFLQKGAIMQDLAGTIAKTVAVGDRFTLTVAATSQNAAPTFGFDIQDSSGTSLIGGAITSTPNAPNNPTYADIVVNGTIKIASTEVFLVLSNNIGQIRIDNIRLDYASAGPKPPPAALIGIGGIAVVLRNK